MMNLKALNASGRTVVVFKKPDGTYCRIRCANREADVDQLRLKYEKKGFKYVPIADLDPKFLVLKDEVTEDGSMLKKDVKKSRKPRTAKTDDNNSED